VKTIQKHPLPRSGFGSLALSHGSRIVGVGVEGENPFAYVEQPVGCYTYVHWEVQTVREGDSYADGMQLIGMFDDPGAPVGYAPKLFVVGCING
jgi:hypothetical protein